MLIIDWTTEVISNRLTIWQWTNWYKYDILNVKNKQNNSTDYKHNKKSLLQRSVIVYLFPAM